MKHTERLPNDACPFCRAELDAALATQGSEKPTSGSLTICIYCGEVSIFDDALRLRPPAVGELDAIYQDDPAFALFVRQAQQVVKEATPRH